MATQPLPPNAGKPANKPAGSRRFLWAAGLGVLALLVAPWILAEFEMGVPWRNVIAGAGIHDSMRYSATAALAVVLLAGLVALAGLKTKH